MNALAKEIDQLQKNWDSAEKRNELLTDCLNTICELLTTDLEGHHTHAQRNGMVILIREHARCKLREAADLPRPRGADQMEAYAQPEDISF